MTNRRFAIALFGVALVAAVTGPMVLPHALVWITVGVIVWAAGTIWYRTVDWPALRARAVETRSRNVVWRRGSTRETPENRSGSRVP